MTSMSLGMEDTACLLGAYSYIEGRLYEVLGVMAADESLPRAALLLEELSQQHAWHASLFADRVPLVGGLDPAPRRSSIGTTVELALARVAGISHSSERLAVLSRSVLPRMATGYRRHLARANPTSDGPVIRALRLVVRDEVEAALECEAVLEECLAGSDPAVALGAVTAIEKLLAPGGPGLVPWPSEPD